jgi:hypothetical protein
LWAATIQLLALRYDALTIERWKDVMATLDISQTPLANLFRREGRAEEARENILALGTRKFGPPPNDVAVAIHAIKDLPRLHLLRDALLEANSWQELLAR